MENPMDMWWLGVSLWLRKPAMSNLIGDLRSGDGWYTAGEQCPHSHPKLGTKATRSSFLFHVYLVGFPASHHVLPGLLEFLQTIYSFHLFSMMLKAYDLGNPWSIIQSWFKLPSESGYLHLISWQTRFWPPSPECGKSSHSGTTCWFIPLSWKRPSESGWSGSWHHWTISFGRSRSPSHPQISAPRSAALFCQWAVPPGPHLRGLKHGINAMGIWWTERTNLRISPISIFLVGLHIGYDI